LAGSTKKLKERRRWQRVAVRSPFIVFRGDCMVGQGLTVNLGRGGALLELNGCESPFSVPEPVQVEIALPRGHYTRPNSLHCKAWVTRNATRTGSSVVAVEFLGVTTGESSVAIDALAPFFTGSENDFVGAVV
jgi:hypothetical protein